MSAAGRAREIASLVKSERQIIDTLPAKVAFRNRTASRRPYQLLRDWQGPLNHVRAIQVITIFVRSVRPRLADLLRLHRIENAVDRVLEKIANAGRQPMATAHHHIPCPPNLAMQKRKRKKEFL